MYYLILAVYFALALTLAWRNFRVALLGFVASLPVYLIRFSLGPLPSTLLELNFGIIFLVWVLKYFRADWPRIKQFFKANHFLNIALAMFFLASIAGILISDQWYISLGQWRAYFLEPLILFVILIGRADEINPIVLIRALVIATIPVSLVAIGQKFFGSWYPPSLWDDNLFGRVTSFFTTPNAIGLFIMPPLLAGIVLFKNSVRDKAVYIGAAILGIIALALSQSVGAFMGLAAGLLVLIALLYSRRLAIATIILGVLLLALPTTRHLLATKTASVQNRFTLWNYSEQFLTSNPKNFVFGAGIRQFFRKVQKEHYTVGGELERLIYAHNIFLNFWTEIGLFGMLAFAFIYYCLLKTAAGIYFNSDKLLGAALLAALVGLLVHGLVDVPYFKNDLAFIFWVLAVIVVGAPFGSIALGRTAVRPYQE